MLPHNTVRNLLVVPLAGGLASAAVVALPALTAPASASSTILCSGYAGCNDDGYSDAGYGAHSGSMYWNMYGGHNCTNYVAYRMVKAGVGTQRPWNGPGNASYWGQFEKNITDQTPTVGAVAWFARGLAGGSDGHVAYVEKVISPTQIVISEDEWNGNFHWAILTKDGGTWPTGFIHFSPARVLTVKTAPSIVGTPTVGKALKVKSGVWNIGQNTYAHQWYADGVAIPGATKVLFTPTAAQLGKAITVKVTTTHTGYTAGTATTPASVAVAPGTLTTTTPTTTVGGTGRGLVGEVITARPGAWAPAVDKSYFVWRADGKVIVGQSAATLTLTPALVGKTITVSQTAKRAGYTKASTPNSASVGPVLSGIVTVAHPFAVTSSTGSDLIGSTLTIAGGQTSPADATVAYQWLRDGQPIAGATGPTYKLTADDVDHHVTATVAASKPTWVPTKQTVYAGRATTFAKMHSEAHARKNSTAAVGVHVYAPGLDLVHGTVTVTVGSQSATATLVDGKARVVLPDLHPGTRKVTVVYHGTDLVKGVTQTGTVTIAKSGTHSSRIPLRGGAKAPAKAPAQAPAKAPAKAPATTTPSSVATAHAQPLATDVPASSARRKSSRIPRHR